MKKIRKGFTIIELLLSMGFLATLMITIALLITLITGIYQKGLSLRAVNSNGRQIVDEITRTVGGSPIVDDINPQDTNGDGEIGREEIARTLRGYFFTNVHRVPADDELGVFDTEVQENGVFCTGAYSYIWNTEPSYALWRDPATRMSANVLSISHPVNGANVTDVYKLARIPDNSRSVCRDAFNDNRTEYESLVEPIELINSDEADLILYDFSVFPATQNTLTGQTFYSASFILATG